MTDSIAKAHRLLAPRIAYLIGIRDHGGVPNVIPVSNVTSTSTDPQHVLLAVYKQWRTYETASGLSFDYDKSSYGPVLVDGVGWVECRVIQLADFDGDHGIIIGQAQRTWFNPEFLDLDGVPHTQTNPLMQVTGNRFTTTTQLQQVPYFDY
jgi:flavin reductase (DIM6/NTAB) family NADH-FMN oxidoreductase RutF